MLYHEVRVNLSCHVGCSCVMRSDCLGMSDQCMAQCVVQGRRRGLLPSLTSPLSPQESGGRRTAWRLYRAAHSNKPPQC